MRFPAETLRSNRPNPKPSSLSFAQPPKSLVPEAAEPEPKPSSQTEGLGSLNPKP